MPFQLNKASVTLNKIEIETLVREAVDREGYKAGKVQFNYYEGRGGDMSLSATVELEFPKPETTRNLSHLGNPT